MTDPRALSGAYVTKTHRSTSYDFISPLKLDFAGKHVLITGAAWEDGVGFATASAFARAGASVIAIADLHGISDHIVGKLKLLATQAGRPEPVVLGCTVDISELQSVQALGDTLSKAFGGRLDVVVNNAAHQEPQVPFLDSDPEVYWRTWEVNVHGLMNMTRVFLPTQLQSKTNGGLCIMINIASSGALSVRSGGSSYRSSKLAVLRWTETLQMEYGEQGLLTLCVNPGAIKTKITEGLMPDSVRDRFPDKADVAGDTVAWLAAERREWLGGRYLSCVWDMEELMREREGVVGEDKFKLRMQF
ncbi:NAD(P)-binding Rossmann-fold containing protein [Glarea lozoyensis ATCC 20868]|uniref:NAD(P)-binding Rossmann-fold containing protein n=1 Tax=Glarea lozoyensis (strain ATCC 20868 / MF5171) TaxID=1116229 RepID=S3D9H9_GLAL2|nr:NAD(P)-binding Rossmann-fold containing protein [Glarea lozoyensis ATCC 20868]EPE35137.1 NAD(P)-binding Rossmann-fold containing protein [Glarea lozoyensis ATCC 20868]